MERGASRASIIGSIIAKDLKAFSRDKIWAGLTILGLVAYTILFWLLPNTVDESITVGVYHTDMTELLEGVAEEEDAALDLVEFESEADLEAAVAGEFEFEEGFDEDLKDRIQDVAIGIAFPAGFVEDVSAGERTGVAVYVDAAVPEEIRDAMSSFVREIAFQIGAMGAAFEAKAEAIMEEAELALADPTLTPAEQAAIMEDAEAAIEDIELTDAEIEEAVAAATPVEWPAEDEIILGEDRVGAQIPFRNKVRPLLAYFVLMMESFALAGLIAVVVQQKTMTAMLVTPARLGDVLAAKSIFGTLIAFTQAVVILALIGALGEGVTIILTAILIAAVLIAGIGMFVGSAGKDFMATMFLGIAWMIPLAIPTFSVLWPGTVAAWVKVIPTYGVVQTLIDVTAYGDGWSEVLPNLGLSLAWAVPIFVVSLWVLKRRVEAL